MLTSPSPVNVPLNELDIIQNPTLGAYLLWRFAIEFQVGSLAPPSFALLFIVLPLLLHKPTLDVITSTQRPSGLLLFAAKLGKEQDNLLAVHDRALLLRQLTLESILLAVQSKLLSIDYEEAIVRGNTIEIPNPVVPERLKPLMYGAEKLGIWCSKVSLNQIATTLKVDF